MRESACAADGELLCTGWGRRYSQRGRELVDREHVLSIRLQSVPVPCRWGRTSSSRRATHSNGDFADTYEVGDIGEQNTSVRNTWGASFSIAAETRTDRLCFVRTPSTTRRRPPSLHASPSRPSSPAVAGRAGVRAAALWESCSRAPFSEPASLHCSPFLVVVAAGLYLCGRGCRYSTRSSFGTRRGHDGGSQAAGRLQPRILERSSEPELPQA